MEKKRLKFAEVPVVFRYDDYWASMDDNRLSVERKIIKIHAENNVPVTIGVTPRGNQSREKPKMPLGEDQIRIKLLKKYIDKDIVEVALHGNSHTNLGKDGDSEFRGVSKEKQHELITIAKNSLKRWLNQDINIFIPPWNSYDKNTLEILKKEKFKILSASFTGGPRPEEIYSIPVWAGLSKIENIFQMVKKQRDSPPVIILMHVFDFFESGYGKGVISLNEYEKIIEYVAHGNYLKGVNLSWLSNNPKTLEYLSPTVEVLGVPLINNEFINNFDKEDELKFSVECDLGSYMIFEVNLIKLFGAINGKIELSEETLDQNINIEIEANDITEIVIMQNGDNIATYEITDLTPGEYDVSTRITGKTKDAYEIITDDYKDIMVKKGEVTENIDFTMVPNDNR